MKNYKIVFWITTVIISFMMIFSAYNYLTNEEMKAAFVHLGFPSYFRVELAIAKILGAIALVVPGLPFRLKEFAYFGFGITFTSACIAHLSSGDPISVALMPFVFLILLFVSYIYYRKIRRAQRMLIP